MLLFPTIEDQEAMERLHEILPNDTRISTAQLPVGCGIQLMVKLEGMQVQAPPRDFLIRPPSLSSRICLSLHVSRLST